MKELSKEEKSKRYDEAIERAKKWYNAPNVDKIPTFGNRVIEEIFPELKESEDDRIRKEIITHCRNTRCVTEEGAERIVKWIAWLEKQGEQNLFDYENANIQQKDFAPKQELKIHEGEWLCENEPNNYARFIQILEIVNVQGKDRYRISRDIHKDEDVVEFGYVEKYYHKFDIQDAKDGDVLYSPCCKLLWIYKDEKTCHVGSNLNYNSGSIVINKPICIPTDVHPATKEQRDQLEKAMVNAGYEWDAEKKELKKIEKQEKLKWTEEDEIGSDETIELLEYFINYAPEFRKPAMKRSIDWLKSLKDRIGG